MANTKPFVAAALFCEKLLQETGNIVSAIRIVDTYIVPDVPPPGMVVPENAVPAIEVNGVIILKSGDVLGDHTLRLVMRTPVGEAKVLSPAEGWPVVLKGGEHGVTINLSFPLGVKNYGLCWFDVIWDGEVLTSMPLMLRRKPADEKQTS